MDYKDLTAILLKITGALLVFWYLPWLPSAIPTVLKEPFDVGRIFVELLPGLVGLGIAYVIFKFPATISNKLINGEKLSNDDAFVETIQVAALRLIGIYHLFIGTTDLVHHFSKAILTPRILENMGINPPDSGWTPDLVAWTIATFLELAIALWFALGAEGIIRFFYRIRGRIDFQFVRQEEGGK